MEKERELTFKWIYAAIAVVLVLITAFAVTFAIQEHNDRVLSEEITETASELQETGGRIASIRAADMKDMNDYVRAFSEMAPLLDSYDRELQRITALYNESRARDKSRFRVDRLYRKPHITNRGKHVGDSGYHAGVKQSHEAGSFGYTEHGSTPRVGANAVLA